MDADGLNQVNLSNDVSIKGEPIWSPDGSKIAFLTTRDGNDEVYSMDADGSNQTSLTNGPGRNWQPAWKP